MTFHDRPIVIGSTYLTRLKVMTQSPPSLLLKPSFVQRLSRNRPRSHTHVTSLNLVGSTVVLYAHNLKRRARTHTLAANLVVALGGSP